LGLSKRRAEAVKNYLVTNHGISASRIVPVGKASDELLDPSDPNSPANRRVQLETLN
jgi:flagellar motor protein MotB